jgi:hypothetical protein
VTGCGGGAGQRRCADARSRTRHVGSAASGGGRWRAVTQTAQAGVGPDAGRSSALTGAQQVRLRAVVSGADLRLGPVSGLSQLLSDRCVWLPGLRRCLSEMPACRASSAGWVRRHVARFHPINLLRSLLDHQQVSRYRFEEDPCGSAAPAVPLLWFGQIINGCAEGCAFPGRSGINGCSYGDWLLPVDRHKWLCKQFITRTYKMPCDDLNLCVSLRHKWLCTRSRKWPSSD